MLDGARRSVGRRAFTIIELMVVASVLALLIAILVPSLSRARIQAKLTACQANLRQIGMLVSIYQSESAEFVPLVFDYWSNTVIAGSKPAEQCWLSVALRKYDARTRHMEGRGFDPRICWPEPSVAGLPRLTDYHGRILPELFVCPFERGKPVRAVNPIRENRGEYQEFRFGGTWESYHTWTRLPHLLQRWASGPLARYDQKYPTLYFNRDERHRKWTTRDAHAAKRGSLAEMTTVFCAQGEFMSTIFYPGISCTCTPTQPFWANIGSHPGADGGGTNALLADGHAEWVPGYRIGSP